MPISVPPYMPQGNYSRPNVDVYGMVSGLGDALQQGLELRHKRGIERATRQAFADGIPVGPDGNPDYGAMAAKLFQVGDIQTGMGLTRLAEAQSNTLWQRSQPIYRQGADGALYDMNPRSPTYSGGGQQSAPAVDPGYQPPDDAQPDAPVQADESAAQPQQPPRRQRPAPQQPQPQQTADAGLRPVIPGKPKPRRLFRMPDGSVIDQDTGETVSPAQKKPLSPTDKKAILEADDAVRSNETVIGMFDQALTLNEKALSGPTAKQRSEVAGALPDWMVPGSRQAALDTQNLDNLVLGTALPQLKQIFGGNPTEGERGILLELQGSVNQPMEVRRDIYKRARDLANIRLQTNRQRAAALRNRTYFDSGDDLTAGPAEDTGGDTGADAPDANGGNYPVGTIIDNPDTGQSMIMTVEGWVPYDENAQ